MVPMLTELAQRPVWHSVREKAGLGGKWRWRRPGGVQGSLPAPPTQAATPISAPAGTAPMLGAEESLALQVSAWCPTCQTPKLVCLVAIWVQTVCV